jgi:hypothetical protein
VGGPQVVGASPALVGMKYAIRIGFALEAGEEGLSGGGGVRCRIDLGMERVRGDASPEGPFSQS